jgi:hypothetical protein
MYTDLVGQLAREQETIAGFVAACRQNIDAVVKCLYNRGWQHDSIEKFRNEVMSTTVDENARFGPAAPSGQEKTNDV